MRTASRVCTATCLLAVLASPLTASGQNSTREVTDRYLELTLSQQYDALLEVYAEDAVFHDPTGDVFSGPVAGGPVEGAETIVEMQKEWGLAEARLDRTVAFTVGQYSLYRGTYNARYEGSDAWTRIPFVTVLRAVGGRIAERMDFGEYIEAFGLGDGFQASTERTEEIADRYLRAYLDGDIETQGELMHADIRFQDATAQVYGPNAGQLIRGARALLARRRQIYLGVDDFDLEVSDSFVANHHAVFMGTTTYTTKNGQHYAQPAVFVIEVKDGKVTRHWDFVDYSVRPTG